MSEANATVPQNRAKWFKGYLDALHKKYDESIDILDCGYGLGFSAGLAVVNDRNLTLIDGLLEDCDRVLNGDHPEPMPF
jgi:hypothetical protein